MAEPEEIWRPGSFTKNFSWGRSSGLMELHSIIRIGFNDRMEDVPRSTFLERIKPSGRPTHIPMNFFLLNRVDGNEDFICVDELVFQALSWDHSPAFDRLALFAFLFSYVGRWKTARTWQRRPALWANSYIIERVSPFLHWNVDKVTSDDIQKFVKEDPRYQAETSRKLATNLKHLLHIGHIQDFSEQRVTRWWVDCLFLALDRLAEDARIDQTAPHKPNYSGLLAKSKFLELTGGGTMEKNLAVKHLVHLYSALGGRERFSDEAVILRTREMEQESNRYLPNDPRPRGAVHRTNPRILKSIPPICGDLADKAGFDVIYPDEMEDFQVEEFIKNRTKSALAILRNEGVRPIMTIEELMKMTRGE